jgi:hypothetical protein
MDRESQRPYSGQFLLRPLVGATSRAQARRQAGASGPRCEVSAPATGSTALTARRACHQSACTSRDRVATAASTRSEKRWAFSP